MLGGSSESVSFTGRRDFCVALAAPSTHHDHQGQPRCAQSGNTPEASRGSLQFERASREHHKPQRERTGARGSSIISTIGVLFSLVEIVLQLEPRTARLACAARPKYAYIHNTKCVHVMYVYTYIIPVSFLSSESTTMESTTCLCACKAPQAEGENPWRPKLFQGPKTPCS